MFFKKEEQKKLLISIIGTLLLLIAFCSIGLWEEKRNLPEHKTLEVQKEVQKRQLQLKGWLLKCEKLLDTEDDLFNVFPSSFYKELRNENIILFFYKNDTIDFWTSLKVPVNTVYDSNYFSSKCIHLRNGWYLAEVLVSKNSKVVALSLVKNTFESNQKLLPDKFIGNTYLPSSVQINQTHIGYSVFGIDNEYMFSIQDIGTIKFSENIGIGLGILFCLFLFFAFSLLRNLICTIFRRQSVVFQSVLLSLFFFLFLFLFLYLKIPKFLYHVESFEKYYYSSTDLISLGSLVIVLLAFLQYVYYLVFPKKNIISTMPLRKYNFSYAVIWGILGNSAIFCYLLLVSDFVKNTGSGEIYLDIFRFDFYVFLLLLAISILTLITAIILWYSTDLMNAYTQRKHFTKAAAISLLPFLFLFFYSVQLSILVFFIVGSFYTSYYIFKRVNNNTVFVAEIFSIVVIFSIGVATQVMWSYEGKEKAIRELSIKLLPIESDLKAEKLFAEKYEHFSQDSTLRQMILKDTSDMEVRNYFKKKYLSNYWNQYYFSISTLTPKEAKEEYFEEKYPSKSSVPNLFYKNSNWQNFSYIGGPIMFKINNNDTLLLYLFFSQNRVFKNMKLTDLLVPESAYKNYEDFSHYSFAKYAKGHLEQSFGDYPYLSEMQEYFQQKADSSKGRYFNKNRYSHLALASKDKETCWVISYKNPSILTKSQMYSFIFLIFCGATIFFFLINKVVLFNLQNNLKTRLQITLIVIVLISFVFVGIVSVIYINDMNVQKNDDFLKEKLNFLRTELEQEYANCEISTPFILKKLDSDIQKYNKVYEMGISVFNPKGKLLVSSSPEVYEAGIVSQYANPIAIKELRLKNEFSFQKGEIGKIKYRESYFALKNKKKELLFYVNIPTFTKPGDARKELITFISAYANIYVIFIIISLIIIVIVTSYITRPLKIIREQIGKLSLNKKNQRIDWESNDDLGRLVNEYNNMVDKIEENAYLLAKSERESGWHEIAREIAHEIKNPLTPMKLSIQQLLRTWKDQSPDFGERMQKTTNLLVEQIDLLAAIANEFSDLAKLSVQKKGKVDLLYCLNSAKELSEVNDTNAKIELQTNVEPYVFADKQQLIRAFVNLLKNAQEAVDKKEDSIISVQVKLFGNFLKISIKDNGRGISEAMKKNIFNPYYTTKKSGTGLGLTIVKGIVEGSGGTINFYSEEAIGTTFIILLPVYTNGE